MESGKYKAKGDRETYERDLNAPIYIVQTEARLARGRERRVLRGTAGF